MQDANNCEQPQSGLQVTRVENGKLWTDYVRFRRNISRTQELRFARPLKASS